MITINFSKKAQEAFKKMTQKNQNFMIDIVSYNCCDIQFALIPCDSKPDYDKVVVDEATIFISKDLSELFERFDIDYEEGVFKKSFTFQAYRR